MLSLLKNIAKFAVLFVIGVYVSIWAFSPYAAHHFISQYLEGQYLQGQYLEDQPLELGDETSIRYNPFLSKLTIDSLTVNQNATRVLTLSSLSIELSAYRLLSDEVNVSELLIDGLYLLVNKQKTSLSIAGFNLSSGVDKTQVDTESKEDTNNTSQADESPLQLIIPQLLLTNSKIEIIDEASSHVLHIKDLEIDVTTLTPSQQRLSLTMLADFNDADLYLSATTDLKNALGDINIDVDIEDIDLKKFSDYFEPHISLDNGFISYKGQHTVKLMETGLHLDVSDFGVSTQGMQVNKNDLHFSLGENDFNSPLLSVELTNDAELTVKSGGDLLWKDVSVFHKTKDQVLVAITQLALNDLDIFSENGEYKITINETSLSDSFFSNNTDDEIPALTLFSRLELKEMAISNTNFALNTIELTGLHANVSIDEDKQIKNLVLSLEELAKAAGDQKQDTIAKTDPVAVEKTEPEKELETVQKANEFHITLNRFSLVDSANIQFSDLSVSPNYARYINVNELSAGPFDNQNPNQTSLITVKGTSNQYATFDFKVKAKPFLIAPEYDVKGLLNQMNIASLTPYVKDALGYEIESGQLDLNLDVQLIGTLIDGDAHILLRGIEMSSVENYEHKESSSQTYVPLNAALGMLKDDDGNVDLDLPLSGDTSSPSFGLSGFLSLIVKRATIAGAKEYLTMTFVPYAGLVKIVMAADKHLLKLEISDLEYIPTEVDVPDDQPEFLMSFEKLLNDKTDLQIKLCGVSSAEDIGKEQGTKLSKAEIETLISISEKRAENFKQYMVEERKVSSSRLLLCKPKLDRGVGIKPHLSFEI